MFTKHVGKVGDRKVAIVFREVPGDEHMCLIVYTEIINAHLHDDLIKAIESKEAQATDNLSEVLNRSYTSTGQVLLQVLHNQRLLKKIQCEQVFVTPTPNSKVRLSELNEMLNKMAQGEEAIRQMEEMESSKGMQMPADVRRRREEAMAAKERARAQGKMNNSLPPVQPLQAGQGALDDNAIATNLQSQASRMLAEAQSLMAEATRMQKEAAQLSGAKPETKAKTKPAAKEKVAAVKADAVVAKPKKERVKKVKEV
jgi:uncharacterized protein with von Willebrand factor type A (vWA) domain